jgi:hypothetical protein
MIEEEEEEKEKEDNIDIGIPYVAPGKNNFYP